MSDAGFSSPDKDARIAELEAALASARADISARDILIDTLRVQIARLRRMQFGTSSEKLTQEIAQLELALEELEAEAVVTSTQRADPVSAERPTPIRALPAHLPREERRIEPEQGSCTCPDCGGALRPLGQDSEEMLDAVPVQWRVVRTIRPKYSCRACEKVVQAAAPVKAIVRGKATFATLAHVVVAKFDHHLPLYRQAEMMAAQGIALDRSTLAGWAGQASALLDPIVSRIREVGLTAAKIHTDDTPVPMLDPGRGKTATGRLWAYVVDDRGSGATSPPLVWYHFTQDRTGAHPRAQLGRFTGFLQADGYAGYDQLYTTNRITEVACWAHFRRKIFDIHTTKPTPLTTDLLTRIASLYKIEDEIRGAPPDARRRTRLERAAPVIEALRITLDDIEPAIWRRVELPLSNSFKTLHLAIQAVMLFENYHLFRFDVGEASYGIRFDDDYMDPPTRDAGNLRLAKLIERGITDFTYTYDFGDDWRHSIVVEEVLPADPSADYPRFVDGERRAPPEDVGGPPGFEEFLDAMARPRHPEHKSVLEWYGRTFDTTDISPDDVNARMATLAKRRSSGKAAHASKKA